MSRETEFLFLERKLLARPFAFVASPPSPIRLFCALAIPRVVSFAAHSTQTLFMLTPPHKHSLSTSLILLLHIKIMWRKTKILFLWTKVVFLETNSLGRPFAFVTPFSHPSFCALAIPVSFLCRSLYPHPNHAHPPQKLFSTSPSFFYYEFLLTPPPQTLSFHFPHFSVTKQKFCFLKQSHSPDHLLSSPPSPIRLLVV